MNDRPVPDGLKQYWGATVEEFSTLDSAELEDWERERHRMYSLLVCSVIFSKWNGNKYGSIGDYGGWREHQRLNASVTATGHLYRGGTYEGHNIAAIAVDGEGRIIDFEFNHNNAFDSTVEHAESRLVRRVFALNQIYAPWKALAGNDAAREASELRKNAEPDRRYVFATATSDRPVPHAALGSSESTTDVGEPIEYNSLLKDVTIYTSLESCAQCSGIMCLANVKEVVYLQWDQGQFLIGNILHKATEAQNYGFRAPKPIRGDEFGFEYFDQLNEGSRDFDNRVASTPFYFTHDGTGKKVQSPSVTSFLCTDAARSIFERADHELNTWTTSLFPESRKGAKAFTNQQVLQQARDFSQWVKRLSNRGTPHRV